MPPKRTAPSEGEQKHEAKVVKPLRRSDRLEKAAAAAAAAVAKEESKPQKRARKLSPKPKKQPKGKKKITKEEVSPAQNGETKPDEIHVSRPSVSVTSARDTPLHSLSVKGQVETVAVKGMIMYTVCAVYMLWLTLFLKKN
ncbi:high mobility group nucleosome-binding domain-containing protein 3 isoform X2 [Rhincodon typus]|uniref:high mobility group nucleosome-binding domain-containing protein 3 isoform X2 n=1 Tax=Rhincodon typus TaxID=259920 RepID=UPI002030C1A5|nr:high mobility group nucleosome-binding domain-containing protein 3 isoform X2 [Rhincodon typus]